jgi:uncharacterized membrane protein YeaQ/YmgE (transglycosylase-associated protein family)
VTDLLVALVIGAIVGWLAGLVMKAKTGLLASIAIGVVGSALGSWLFGVLGFAAYGTLARWVVAVAGAALLIALLRTLKLMR